MISFAQCRNVLVPLVISSVVIVLSTISYTHAFSTVELEGYAWSSNIGWISMNCSNDNECGISDYKVQINPDKTLSGYAWSSNIGWIQFGGLSGFPASGGNAAVTGDYLNGWGFGGWVRALSYGNGWDGWISLEGVSVTDDIYGVTFNRVGYFNADAYAWGDDVIGWINFTSSYFTPPNPSAGYTCNADYSGTIYTDMWGDEPPGSATTCANGEVCTDATNSCTTLTVNGPITLTVTPSLVRKNDTVTIDWSVTDTNFTCSVISNDGGSWTSSPATSNPLTYNTNIFTLSCTPISGGGSVDVASTTVKMLPSVYEF